MTADPVIAWGLFTVIGLLVAVFVVSQARIALRRRARRRYYRHAAQQGGHGAPPAHGLDAIPPEQVASISQDAQQAAWRVAHDTQPRATNPHPARTRAFVLWEATFHSAMSDFQELPEDRQDTAAQKGIAH